MPDLEQNERVTLQFLELAFDQGRMQEALERYVDSRHIVHSALDAIGPADSIARGTWVTRQHFRGRHEIQRIIAEGDLVAVQSLVTFRNLETAVVDIFRVRDGKLVEHWGVWDIVKPVPSELQQGHVTV